MIVVWGVSDKYLFKFEVENFVKINFDVFKVVMFDGIGYLL